MKDCEKSQEEIEYKCKEHSYNYSKYCEKCKIDICGVCYTYNHKNHQIQDFDTLLLERGKVKEKKDKMESLKENLLNKQIEFKGIYNKIEELKSVTDQLNEDFSQKYNEIKSNIKIIDSYENNHFNYCILNKMKSFNSTIDVNLDRLYETINKLKLFGENNMWISEYYCKDWGLREGIREFLQNQYDEIITSTKTKENLIVKKAGLNFEFIKKDENKICGKIEYDKINKTLSISNDGQINLADFLLGGIKDEQQNDNLIGHFGEGMKLATLALCRINKNVTIISSNQKYNFVLKEDPNFKMKLNNNEQNSKNSRYIKCLHCRFESANKDCTENQVKVTISNISENEWNNEIYKYLWLIENDIEIYTSKVTKNNKECDIGQLILEDKLKGKLYIKGIYVQEISNYNFEKNLPGFNSYNLKTNRDRNIIENDYELRKDLSKIISGIINKNNLENEKKKPKTLVRNKSKESNSYFYGFLNSKFKDLIHNLIYCLKNKLKKIFDSDTLSSELSLDSKNIIWNEISSREKNKNKQPIYDDWAIKEFIKSRKLSKDFYPYYMVNWDLFNILKGSSYYESIEKKFSKYNETIKLASVDVDHKIMIDNIISILKEIFKDNNINIQFKIFDIHDSKFCYRHDNNYIFSSEKLKEKADIKWEFWILIKILKIQEENIEDHFEIFNKLFK